MTQRISVVVVGSDGGPPLHLPESVVQFNEGLAVEVIVVQRGSGALRAQHDGLPSAGKEVRNEHPNFAAACNTGIRAAAGEFVVFMDAGWYPGPTWLSGLLAAFADGEVAASGGPLLDSDGVTVRAGCWVTDSFGAVEVIRTVPAIDVWSSPFSDVTVCPVAGNSVFRRSALVEIGGFDERYDGDLAHVDVCRRLLDHGWAVRPTLDGAAFPVPHPVPASTDELDVVYDRVLFAMTHGLRRHSFADVARHISLFTGGDFAANEVDRAFEQWRSSPSRTSPSFDDAPRAFAPHDPPRPTPRRLHVCYVSQEWLPAHNGIARLVHARASGLAARGHVVRVLTLTDGPLTVALEDGIWVHRIPSVEHPPPADIIMPPRLWNRSASVLDELMRISEAQPVDVVDVPNWDVEGYATILDGRFTTVLGLHSGVAAYVATDPRFSASDPIVQEVLDAERTCYLRADAFIAASQAVVAEIEHGFDVRFPRNRLALVPHGLPELELSQSQPTAVHDLDLDVLFVGRLEPRKGVDTLLEAIPIVLEAVPSVRFSLVGDDRISSPEGSTFREEFERSSVGRRLADRVSFAGLVDNDELARRYWTCDVFVAPSRFESFGLVLLEAMRLGKPVIAGDAGGMREVVGNGGAGLLVPPGSSEALARALISLLVDTQLRSSIGAAGRRRFEERFTQDRMIDGIETFFFDVVASSRDSRASTERGEAADVEFAGGP